MFQQCFCHSPSAVLTNCAFNNFLLNLSSFKDLGFDRLNFALQFQRLKFILTSACIYVHRVLKEWWSSIAEIPLQWRKRKVSMNLWIMLYLYKLSSRLKHIQKPELVKQNVQAKVLYLSAVTQKVYKIQLLLREIHHIYFGENLGSY